VTEASADLRVIKPRGGFPALELAELWEYRELAWFLALRDIRVRYKQTILGVGWSILYPLLAVGVFSLLFSLVLGKDDLPTVPGIPYAVSTLCALVPWQLFASSLSASGNSLVKNEPLITKVYFPRMVAPLAPLLVSLVDFGVSFLVLAAALAWVGIVPGFAVLTLPFFVLLTLLSALAVGLWVSVIGAVFRDVSYALDRIIPLWMFATPVVYTTAQLPEGGRGVAGWVLALNPMTSVVEGFRWALLGAQAPEFQFLSLSVVIMALFLTSGLFFFRRLEKIIVDLV
jgi:lipopolysaccharide transport system permease protein